MIDRPSRFPPLRAPFALAYAALALCAVRCGLDVPAGAPGASSADGSSDVNDAGYADTTSDTAVDTASDVATIDSAYDGSAADTLPAQASFRLLHASFDTAALALLIDGDEAARDHELSFGETSEALDIDPGTHVVSLRGLGHGSGQRDIVASGEVTVPAGARVLAVLVGESNPPEERAEADGLRLLIMSDDALEAGLTLRLVNGASLTGAVDVDLDTDGVLDWEAVEPYTVTEPLVLTPDESLTLSLYAGEESALVDTFTLGAGSTAGTMVLVGRRDASPASPGSLQILTVSAESAVAPRLADPVVYVLNEATNLPTLDLFAGTTELVDGLSVRDLSGPLRVGGSVLEIGLYAHVSGFSQELPPSAEDAPLGELRIAELEGGNRYLAVVTGPSVMSTVETGPQVVLVADRFAEPDAEGGWLRLLHASPDAPCVSWCGLPGDPDEYEYCTSFDALCFGESTDQDGIFLNAGLWSMSLDPAATEEWSWKIQLDVTPASRGFLVFGGSFLNGDGEDEDPQVGVHWVETTERDWSVVFLGPYH